MTQRKKKNQKKSGAIGCLIAIAIVIGFTFAALVALGAFLEYTEGKEDTFTLPTVPDNELTEGMCFEDLDYVHGNHFQPVSCDLAHQFEVMENAELMDGDYPGLDELAQAASSMCEVHGVRAYEELNDFMVSPYWIYPSESTWEQGDRTVTCFISIAAPKSLVGSFAHGDVRVEE